MERVAMDIFGPLPTTKRGNKYILVVSDYFTRWVEAYSLPNSEAPTVARTLVSEWICRYGAPDAIHTDQGKNFESRLFSELCTLLGIHKTRTTPYHPQSDGLIERFNRTLRMMLTIHMEQCPEDTWDDHLPMLMLAYRSSVQESTRFTPFQLMFGREVQLPVDLVFGGGPAPGESPGEYVKRLRQSFEASYSVVRERMHLVQKQQKQLYDRKAAGGRYAVGDLVWLHSPAVPRGKAPKFHRPWRGPFQIVKVLSDVTFRIQLVPLPDSRDRRRRHRLVVHFDRLKPCHFQKTQQHGNMISPARPAVVDSNMNENPDPVPPAAPPAGDGDSDAKEWTVPLPVPGVPSQNNQSISDPSSSPEPASESTSTPAPDPPPESPDVLRGGAIWGHRLRHTVRPPDFYRPESALSHKGGSSVMDNTQP